MIHRQSWIF